TERAAYRTKFYSNLSSPTQFDEEPKKVVTQNLSQLFSNKRYSKACICGNKSNQVKNIRCCFYFAILIT
ncbi:hypothetical protein, partial [Enterococcus faecium]|uniref:hypothetical protein n=1 Tax=Enterococcus faecium TaxID=1352 RepID=UPI00226FD492